MGAGVLMWWLEVRKSGTRMDTDRHGLVLGVLMWWLEVGGFDWICPVLRHSCRSCALMRTVKKYGESTYSRFLRPLGAL